MSKGSPVIPLLIPKDLLAEINATIARMNTQVPDDPWTRSGFIVAAIWEKLARSTPNQGLPSLRYLPQGETPDAH